MSFKTKFTPKRVLSRVYKRIHSIKYKYVYLFIVYVNIGLEIPISSESSTILWNETKMRNESYNFSS